MYPSPARQAMLSVEFKNTNGKEATKGIAKLRTTVQNRSTQRKLLAVVEDGEKVQGSREEDCLDKADAKPGNQQPSEVVNRGHGG